MLKNLNKHQKILIYQENLTGDFSNLEGYAKNVRGKVSPSLRGIISPYLKGEISPDLYGEISPNLLGDITGITGDCTGIIGYLDECGLTDYERDEGVEIKDLVR